ncbi:MAG: PQQ-binding-like beta-propeller repeat protein, partial [Candidatus Woesearchaeota archaeon]
MGKGVIRRKSKVDGSLDSLVSDSSKKNFSLVWEVSFDYSEIPYSLLADDKSAFVSFAQNGTRAIASLDLKDGATRWEQVERGSLFYPMYLTKDSIFVVKKTNGDEPDLLSLEKKKGRRVGSFSNGDLKGVGSIERVIGTYGPYTLVGFSNKLVSFDWKLGVVWDLPIPCENPDFVLGKGGDAVIKTSSGLYRVNINRGKALWQFEAGRLGEMCYVLDNVAYVKRHGDGNSEICAVDLDDGKAKWSVADDSEMVARFFSSGRSLRYIGYAKSSDGKYVETCNSLSLKTGRKLGASKGIRLRCTDLSVHMFDDKELVLACAGQSNYEMSVFSAG